ncbi:NAD(P)-dependent oxidoreductase [Frankia gtarii]|uniref:NAD(P)-dependent oxidoreductase n=1 Tax=Frankia gtarii TaxID=2950102 RepID=UPI0021C23CFD|nr:NAD(P)-dependent oxidoreductase [Frankia gtarii]
MLPNTNGAVREYGPSERSPRLDARVVTTSQIVLPAEYENFFDLVFDATAARSEQALAKALQDADAAIVGNDTRIGAAAIGGAHRLQVIGRLGVGLDNIDLAAASEAGISVVHAPGANASSVAEYCLAQLISAVRCLPEAALAGAAGQWAAAPRLGRELSELTVGLVGFGAVSRSLAELLEGPVGTLLVYTRSPEQVRRRGLQAVSSLLELARDCDVISLHLPATPDTRLLIGEKFFTELKPGAVLLNTGRGSVIDEVALLNALETGRVASAVLDVRASEPASSDALSTHPRVVATPHVGALTLAARRRVVHTVVGDVVSVLTGRMPRFPAFPLP